MGRSPTGAVDQPQIRQAPGECLAAHAVGYGTNDVPNPPYMDRMTA
jgi:hypothetical protein